MAPKYSLTPIPQTEVIGQVTYTWFDALLVAEEGAVITCSSTVNAADAPIYRRISGYGAAEFAITNNGITLRITHQFEYDVYTAPFPFVTESLAEVQELINATTGNEAKMNIFSSKNTTSGVYVRNPDLWCGPSIAAQLTGVIAYKLWSGSQERFGGVMITPRHFLCCRHAHTHASGTWAVNNYAAFNSDVHLVTVGNQTITKTHIAQGYPNSAGLDLCVGVLDSDVPASIHIMPVTSITRDQTGNQLNTSGVIAMVVSQGSGGVRSPLIPPDGYPLALETVTADYPIKNEPMLYLNHSQRPFAEASVLEMYDKLGYAIWSGDSGTAEFFLRKGNLELAGIVSAAKFSADSDMTLGINQAIYNADLNAISLGRMVTPTGYTITLAPDPAL